MRKVKVKRLRKQFNAKGGGTKREWQRYKKDNG